MRGARRQTSKRRSIVKIEPTLDESGASAFIARSVIHGGIAQLVERFVRNEEARGSNPLTSTFSEVESVGNSATSPRSKPQDRLATRLVMGASFSIFAPDRPQTLIHSGREAGGGIEPPNRFTGENRIFFLCSNDKSEHH